MENGVERNISKESVSKAITLSREISRIKVLGDKSPEANEKARNFLKGNFSTQYENVTRMVELSKDPGRTENDPIRINAKKDLDLLGAAMLLAGQDKIEGWIVGGEVSSHVPSAFADIEKVLADNLLVSGKNDQTGKEIVTQLGILEKASRRAALAPNSYEETRERETKKTIDVLLDKYDNADPDSEDAEKIGAVVGCLDGGLKKAESIIISGPKRTDAGGEGVSPLAQQPALDSGPKNKNGGSELGSSNAISLQELYRHPLTDFSPEEIRKWGANLVLRLGNDSLFFNQGWTQLASFIDAQTYEAKNKIRLSGGEREKVEEEYKLVENACKFVEAAVTVRAHEEALYASDAVLTTYVAALPPADRMTDKRYLWESRNAAGLLQVNETEYKKGEKKEIEPSILNTVHDDLLYRAYSMEKGGVSVDDLRQQLKYRDELAQDYFYKIKDNKKLMDKFEGLSNDEIKNQARLAVSMFIVEDYVPWANWIYTNVGKEIPVWEWKDGKWESNGTSKFDWIEKSDLIKKRRSKMSDERFTGQKEEEVEIWSTDIMTKRPRIDKDKKEVRENGDIVYDVFKTGLENPLMTLIRPVDVLRVKRDFAEDINRPLHEAFYALTSEIWMVKQGGRDKVTHEVIKDRVKSFPKTSELGFKQVSRWAKAWEKMIGDSHGDKVESMEGVSEGAGKIVNMFSTYENNWDRENLAGAIVGNIWAAKIKAALSRGDENFVSNLLRTGAILGEYNKEQSMLVSQIYGSDMSQDFGVIRDAISRLNLNIETPAFKMARKMIVTSSTDEKNLDILYGTKKAFVIANTVGSFISGFKGKGGKKR